MPKHCGICASERFRHALRAGEKSRTWFYCASAHGPVVGTGHNSVVNVPGTDCWYVACHRHAIPNGSGYKREVCLARMQFAASGHIHPMDPMVQPFHSGDRGEPVVNGRGLRDAP